MNWLFYRHWLLSRLVHIMHQALQSVDLRSRRHGCASSWVLFSLCLIFLTVEFSVNDTQDANVALAADAEALAAEVVNPEDLSKFNALSAIRPFVCLFSSQLAWFLGHGHPFMEWTQDNPQLPSEEARRNQEYTKCSELTMTRATFVTTALSAHGYQNSCVPGQASSPGMQIAWPEFRFVSSPSY